MQVLSKALSKKLYDAGIGIKTLWSWYAYPDAENPHLGYKLHMRHGRTPSEYEYYAPAPTADELLGALPDYLELSKVREQGFEYCVYVESFILSPYTTDTAELPHKLFYGDTAAEALGKVALWMVENTDWVCDQFDDDSIILKGS